MMKRDDIDINVVSGGQFWIDGGNMFGVVPKTIWANYYPSDQDNRVRLETNCLVVQNGRRIGVIDSGYGSKASLKEKQRFGMGSGHALIDNLSRRGVDPGDVEWVILSHLHFDHVGGCTNRDGDELKLVFPRARHFIQRAEWEDAISDLPELAGSYCRDDLARLESEGLVELIDGDTEVFAEVSVRLIGGHTRGHQIVLLQAGPQTAAYLSDLCPFATHLRTFWSMAYDQFPLTVRRTKPIILNEAIENRWLVFFSHDPDIKSAYVSRDKNGTQ